MWSCYRAKARLKKCGRLLCWSCCFLSNAPICAVPLLKRVWIAHSPICSMHPLPANPGSSQADSRHKNGDQSPMWNHTKSSIIIRHTLSKLWTSRLISCHYSQIGWSGDCHWSAFLVAGSSRPIGVWAQLYTYWAAGSHIIQRDNRSDYRGTAWSDQGYSYLSIYQIIFVSGISSYICRVLWTRSVNIWESYSALSWECCYHLLRLLLRVSHKQGSQFQPEWGWGKE